MKPVPHGNRTIDRSNSIYGTFPVGSIPL